MDLKIKSLDHLRNILRSRVFGGDFFVVLSGFVRSSKTIELNSDNTWNVFHGISDVWDESLTDKDLEELTNIPEAISKGALFMYDFDVEEDTTCA